MDASRMGYIDLDQIPLPTEPAVVSASQCELTTTPVQTVDDPTQQLCATIGVDPFADVDQLAHITEMMRQDGMGWYERTRKPFPLADYYIRTLMSLVSSNQNYHFLNSDHFTAYYGIVF